MSAGKDEFNRFLSEVISWTETNMPIDGPQSYEWVLIKGLSSHTNRRTLDNGVRPAFWFYCSLTEEIFYKREMTKKSKRMPVMSIKL
jgi:hypothetical protein